MSPPPSRQSLTHWTRWASTRRLSSASVVFPRPRSWSTVSMSCAPRPERRSAIHADSTCPHLNVFSTHCVFTNRTMAIPVPRHRNPRCPISPPTHPSQSPPPPGSSHQRSVNYTEPCYAASVITAAPIATTCARPRQNSKSTPTMHCTNWPTPTSCTPRPMDR